MKRSTLITAARSAFPELTRDEAYAAIVCGEIYVNGERTRDPRTSVAPDAEVTRRVTRYVSRGGLKLEHALDTWDVDVAGKVMLDAGSSTGGFTDCLLQHGVAHVHSVDVGYNQIAFSLRTDPRVSVHERTNIMSVENLTPPPHGAVTDLSFRSVQGAAAHILSLTTEGWAILLIKPQFELRDFSSDFDGVVRSNRILIEVLESVVERLWQEEVYASSILASPILGRKGNREYLFLVRSRVEVEKAELMRILRNLSPGE